MQDTTAFDATLFSNPPLPPGPALEQVREFYSHDHFATKLANCVIQEAAYGYAVCSMELDRRHINAQGFPMGGAVFTLADFALAIACNYDEPPTVAMSNTIDYLKVAKGTRLIATARVVSAGRKMGFYHIDVHDETGVHVAQMSAKCYRPGPRN